MGTFPASLIRVPAAGLRAMALDATAGLMHAAEAANDALAGRTPALATLRVRVLILSDASGPLTVPDRVTGALAAADRILTDGAGVRVRAEAVDTVTEAAPAAVLDPRANRRLLLDHLLGRTGFLVRHLPPRPALSVVADPITVVVVRRIAGNVTGCSLGMTADWVLAQASLFDHGADTSYDETVLAHELGHALNLPHVRDTANLMAPISTPPDRLRGTALAPWQRLVIRSNRHVVPPARVATAEPIG